MIYLRKSKERGYFDHGWLKTYHTFSFGDYHDQKFMGFGPLRVINEDFVAGGQGFPTHGHRNMEIITYPIEGIIAHKDSTGTSGIIAPYQVQKMSAGKGILHSEYNYSPNETLHLLQIWVIPDKNDLSPSYEQRDFKNSIESGRATLLVSPFSKDDSIVIHQDTYLWARKLKLQETWELQLVPQRNYWIQIVRGQVSLNSHNSLSLSEGDGIALQQESNLKLTSITPSEILFFDMI